MSTANDMESELVLKNDEIDNNTNEEQEMQAVDELLATTETEPQPTTSPPPVARPLFQSNDLDSSPGAAQFEIAKLPDFEGLVEFMRCSLCLEIPVPPRVGSCTEGHLICDQCVKCIPGGMCPKLIESPEHPTAVACKTKIGRFKSEIYEHLFNTSSFKCSYLESDNCVETPLGKDLKAHQLCCPNRRDVKCVITDCQMVGLFSPNTYLAHLSDFHKAPSTQFILVSPIPPGREKLTDDKKTHRWICGIFAEHNMKFIMMGEDDGEFVTFWMTRSPDCSIADLNRNFYYQIWFFHVGRDGLMASCQGQVYPWGQDRKTMDKIMLDGQCLTLKKAVWLKKFAFKQKDGVYYFRVDATTKEILDKEAKERAAEASAQASAAIRAAITLAYGSPNIPINSALTPRQIFLEMFRRQRAEAEAAKLSSANPTACTRDRISKARRCEQFGKTD